MDAVLLASGDLVGIRDFERQGRDWAEEHKSQLRCPECGAGAVYVRRSRDGRASCFRAKHAEECPEARTVVAADGNLTDGGARRSNYGTSTRLILSGISLPIQAGAKVVQIDEGAATATRGQRHTGDEAISSNQRTLRLLTLLRRLVRDSGYLQGPVDVLDLGSAGVLAGGDLIREFSEVSAGDVGAIKLVWGEVETVRGKNGTTYVNAGNYGHNPFAITFPAALTAVLLQQESWLEAVEAAQFNTSKVYAIALGQVEKSHGSDYRLAVSDLGCFAYFMGAKIM